MIKEVTWSNDHPLVISVTGVADAADHFRSCLTGRRPDRLVYPAVRECTKGHT